MHDLVKKLLLIKFNAVIKNDQLLEALQEYFRTLSWARPLYCFRK